MKTLDRSLASFHEYLLSLTMVNSLNGVVLGMVVPPSENFVRYLLGVYTVTGL